MKRKIIKQGLGGYTIYLPKKWIDNFKLQAGDEINLDLIDNKLLISAEGIKEKRQTTITVTGENKIFLKTSLIHIYR
jgi:hypothetical protein